MNCCKKQKLEDLLASNAKLAELLHLKKEEEVPEKKNTAVYVFAIIGAIALIAVVAYAVYRYLNPAYVEDGELEDEFEDYGEDDFQEYSDEDYSDEDYYAESAPETEPAPEATAPVQDTADEQ